jgi:hypothetical protein
LEAVQLCFLPTPKLLDISKENRPKSRKNPQPLTRAFERIFEGLQTGRNVGGENSNDDET